jgi:Mg-chelatase subunit ChlD
MGGFSIHRERRYCVNIWYNTIMNFRPWAFWRRLQYIIGTSAFFGLLGVLIFFTNFYVPANCQDGLMNGEESGIDCGGGCVQICAAQALPLRVVWTESFEISEGQYNVVSYIENPNQSVGVPSLNYTFELLSKGEVVGRISGQTVLPPDSIYPIFEGGIYTESQVDSANIIIEQPNYWLPSVVGREQFKAKDIDLANADKSPRLAVEIENTSLIAAENVEVVATVFGENGKAVTASETFIEYIGPRSSKNIVFTWPNPIAKTIKSCIIPTDVLVAIDLSGSMNNDGGDPPQPVTRAVEAAGQFVGSLKKGDQVGVVTFATEAKEDTFLTSTHDEVAKMVTGLSIDSKEEGGFTNTVDALKLSGSVLDSDRHNPDARRVLVLLTDGLPTTSGDEDVVSKAKEVADSLNKGGIEIYAIGLGSGVDQEFIRNIASSNNNAYFAPTGEDLKNIYSEITSSLCESGPTKIDIIAKTETSFAPIQ